MFGDLLSRVVDLYSIYSEENSSLVPIPMHWSRYILRGFDHTGYIAKYVSEETGIPYKKLLSTKWTRPQSKLTREKRLENKKNTFRMRDHAVLPDTVILLDDVISTGSTANEAAKILKEAGVKRVIGIFLASNI